MATVSVTNSNFQRREDMEGAYGGVNIGTGPGGAVDPDFFFQGVQTWGRRIQSPNLDHGISVTVNTVTDMTVGSFSTWMAKTQLTNPGQLEPGGGVRYRAGQTASDFGQWQIRDTGSSQNAEFLYPTKGGFLIEPVNPQITSWVMSVTGSPDYTIVDVFGFTSSVSLTSNAWNNIFDAIDISDGWWLTGGDGADTDATWNDFLSTDEGSPTVGRIGHVTAVEGVLYVFGKLTIGRTSLQAVEATVFQVTGDSLVFPFARVAAGWGGIETDISTSGTDVDFIRNSLVGRAATPDKVFFDTITQVEAGSESIVSSAHTYFTGQAVLYSDEGGTDTIGLTDGQEYFLGIVSGSPDSFTVHSSQSEAKDFQGAIGLTDGSGGENHSLTRQVDVRPDFTLTGSVGAFDATDSSFTRWRNFIFGDGGTFTRCTFTECQQLTVGSGTMDECSIFQKQNPGEAFVIATALGLITTNAFTADEGHAIELTAIGSSNFVGNAFTGYGPNRAQFETDADVNDTTEVITTNAAHGFVDGDEIFYNDEGGSDTIGLTDGVRYYVNEISATTLSLHRSKQNAIDDVNRVDLNATGTGETHSLYSAKAAIYNSSGGAIVIDVANATSPTIRNGTGASTTVNNNVTATVTVKDKAGAVIVGARVSVRLDSDNSEVLGGATDGSGEVTGTVAAGLGGVSVRVRKGSGSGTDYIPVNSPQTIGAGDFEVTITMDEDVNNAT